MSMSPAPHDSAQPAQSVSPAQPASPAPSAAAEPEPAPELLAPPELTAAAWTRASSRLLAKALAEFAYEEILEPAPAAAADPAPVLGPAGADEADLAPTAGPAGAAETDLRSAADSAPGLHALRLDDGTTLTFRARRGAYGSWYIAADTITHEGRPMTDPLDFLVRARRLLQLDGATLGHLIRELSATLAADARLDHTALPAARLADLSYAELEGHQTGHPWLVLNKGRIGRPHRRTR